MTTIDKIDWDEVLPAWRRDLVYVNHDDQFSPEQIEELLRGGFCDHTDEWISDRQWESARELAHELLAEDGPLAGHDPEDLIHEIVERDTSEPYRDLLRNTSAMLFRYSPTEDDMVFLDEELDDPAATRTALGLWRDFQPFVAEILPEIAGYRAEGGGWFGATFVFRAAPGDLVWKFHEDDFVTVSDPFLWLTNPWSGNGYGVVATGCKARLRFGDIHVDRFEWGYGADDVFGGLILDDSTIEEATS